MPTLDFMASGKLPSSSMSILGSAQMRDMIAELKQRYDFIFFDSPPILGVSDASVLASEVDMVMQVIQYRRYPQPMNLRAKQLIEKVGGNFAGIVLNNINMSQDESYYYYSGYYHDYYYSRSEDSQAAAAKDPNAPGDTGRTASNKSIDCTFNFARIRPMKLFVNGLFMSALLFAAAIFAGCDSMQPNAAQPSTPANPTIGVARFQVGDTVVVTLTTGSDQESTGIPPHEDSVKEDGTITLPLIGKVIAVGKTPGELQNEIYDQLRSQILCPSHRHRKIAGFRPRLLCRRGSQQQPGVSFIWD